MKENEIQRQIRLALGLRDDCRLFRNECGVAEIKGARIRFGLVKGSSDLVGWRTLTITPEMVGTQIAQFVGVEVKTAKGRLRPEQAAWMRVVNDAGGRAGVARSISEAEKIIDGEQE